MKKSSIFLTSIMVIFLCDCGSCSKESSQTATLESSSNESPSGNNMPHYDTITDEESQTPDEPGGVYVYQPIEEEFASEDKPGFDLHDTLNYRMIKPWNYDKPHNSDREYPLIVFLHGLTGNTNAFYRIKIVADETMMQAYPCFYISPNNTDQGWGNGAAWVREEIENLKQQYRIDSDRIYLIGFSMGGSGSYPFASAWYNDHGALFAAIIRLAGQSEEVLQDEIVKNTSIWYHVGLDDTARRVNVARNAYDFLKKHEHLRNTVEDELYDSVDGHERLTRTHTLGGVQIVKYSEYTGVAHSPIMNVPFEDPGVAHWLFNQSLKNSRRTLQTNDLKGSR